MQAEPQQECGRVDTTHARIAPGSPINTQGHTSWTANAGQLQQQHFHCKLFLTLNRKWLYLSSSKLFSAAASSAAASADPVREHTSASSSSAAEQPPQQQPKQNICASLQE
eukprot:332316-Pelagomonas_calceolata.AAC.1